MLTRTRIGMWLAVVCCVVGTPLLAASRTAMVAPPSVETVRTRVLEWVATRAPQNPTTLEAVGKLWGDENSHPSANDLFDLTIRSFSVVDPATRDFVASLQLQRPPLVPPEPTVLTRPDVGPFYTANMQLYYGRYLAHRAMYEEALELLDQTNLGDVVDPASLLFFRAVCQHHLLLRDEGLKTLEQLLKNTEAVPVRYSAVATLMQYDLEKFEARTLDEISRKMSDVERRLSLGRTGQKVQKKEDEIIASLEEIIKKIEEQMGGGGGGGAGQGKGNQPSGPADDSVVKGSTAPGEVDKKRFKNQGGWGALPPKARARAKDIIARDFPAHYRQAIEEYTRKQATRAAESGK